MGKIAKIVKRISFGDKYFSCGDIVRIVTQFADMENVHIGRIVGYTDNGVQRYVRLDTSDRFDSSEATIGLDHIVEMDFYTEE